METENISEWYKIVDYDKGEYKTLFHGVNRSRKLKFGEWLESDTKLVTDGSRAHPYWSGWHVTPEYRDCVKYLKNFRKENQKKKRILKCKAKDVWPKENARGNIYLAKHIYIEGVIVDAVEVMGGRNE